MPRSRPAFSMNFFGGGAAKVGGCVAKSLLDLACIGHAVNFRRSTLG
jgi:hypothetical protein